MAFVFQYTPENERMLTLNEQELRGDSLKHCKHVIHDIDIAGLKKNMI